MRLWADFRFSIWFMWIFGQIIAPLLYSLKIRQISVLIHDMTFQERCLLNVKSRVMIINRQFLLSPCLNAEIVLKSRKQHRDSVNLIERKRKFVYVETSFAKLTGHWIPDMKLPLFIWYIHIQFYLNAENQASFNQIHSLINMPLKCSSVCEWVCMWLFSVIFEFINSNAIITIMALDLYVALFVCVCVFWTRLGFVDRSFSIAARWFLA